MFVCVGCSCNNTQCRVSRRAGDTNTVSEEAVSSFDYTSGVLEVPSGTSSGGANGRSDYRHK